MMENYRARRRVARGAAYLNEVYPGWVGQIDVGRLQVLDGRNCPLAQATGRSFETTLQRRIQSDEWLERRGFLVPLPRLTWRVRSYRLIDRRALLLNQAWRDHVTAVRAARVTGGIVR